MNTRTHTRRVAEEPRPLVFWEHRLYPGSLSRLSRVRADLAADGTVPPSGRCGPVAGGYGSGPRPPRIRPLL